GLGQSCRRAGLGALAGVGRGRPLRTGRRLLRLPGLGTVPAQDNRLLHRRLDLAERSGGSIVAVVLIAYVRHEPEATARGQATFPLCPAQNKIPHLPRGVRSRIFHPRRGTEPDMRKVIAMLAAATLVTGCAPLTPSGSTGAASPP